LNRDLLKRPFTQVILCEGSLLFAGAIRLLGLLLIGILGSSCGPPSPPDAGLASEDSHLVLRAFENPPTLDPAKAARTLDGHLACLLHAGLLRSSATGEILGELAYPPEILEEGKRLRFEFQQDYSFPSGRRLGAEDVAYSFSRVCRPETLSPTAWVFEDVLGFEEVRSGASPRLAGIEVLSSTRFDLVLKRPSATFPARLTMPAARLVDREEIERAGPLYGRNPRGLGAWELVRWIDDSSLLLRPNELYPARNSHLSALEFKIVPQDFTAAALFETQGIDILFPVPITQSEILPEKMEGRVEVQRTIQYNTYYLGFNCEKPPFEAPEIRRAIASVLGVDGLRKALYGQQADTACGPVPPGLLGHVENCPETVSEDIDSLQGLSFEVWFVDTDASLSLAMEGIQAELAQHGVSCRLRKTDASTYSRWRREGKFEAFLANWWADYPDPDNFLQPLFHSASPANYTRIKDERLDRMIEEAGETWDSQARGDLYRLAAERLNDLVPAVFLWHRGSLSLSQRGVSGFEPPRLFQGTLYLGVKKKSWTGGVPSGLPIGETH
jgi:ABC-type transport system substrate-binding protein